MNDFGRGSRPQGEPIAAALGDDGLGCRGLSAGGFRKVFFQHFSSLIDQLRLDQPRMTRIEVTVGCDLTGLTGLEWIQEPDAGLRSDYLPVYRSKQRQRRKQISKSLLPPLSPVKSSEVHFNMCSPNPFHPVNPVQRACALVRGLHRVWSGSPCRRNTELQLLRQ